MLGHHEGCVIAFGKLRGGCQSGASSTKNLSVSTLLGKFSARPVEWTGIRLTHNAFKDGSCLLYASSHECKYKSLIVAPQFSSTRTVFSCDMWLACSFSSGAFAEAAAKHCSDSKLAPHEGRSAQSGVRGEGIETAQSRRIVRAYLCPSVTAFQCAGRAPARSLTARAAKCGISE